MKIRAGFVSNSSTSSFICSVCKQGVAGREIGPDDVGMVSCTGGHYLCEGHALPETEETKAEAEAEIRQRLEARAERYRKYLQEEKDLTDEREAMYENWLREAEQDLESGDFDVAEELEGAVPRSRCPVCSMQVLEPWVMLRLLMRREGFTEKELLDDALGEFSTYSEMVKTLDPDKKHRFDAVTHMDG